jgi:hypothetical protein
MSARPTYGTAIMWLIANESMAWLDDPGVPTPDAVRAIADIFEVAVDQIARNLRATLETARSNRG